MKYPTCFLILVTLLSAAQPFANDETTVEVHGIEFPKTKEVGDTKLTLNGVATRKAMGIVKVFTAGLYLETPSQDAQTIIQTEQIKHFSIHYLTDKATGKKLSKGFIKAIQKANPPESIKNQQANIEKYADWIAVDMKPGSVSETFYTPGKGLTLVIDGSEKGTIKDPEFIKMYFTYSLGEKANKKLREGYLGLSTE